MDFVNQYGADILRLWVASQDYRDDVPFSEEIFKRVTDTYRLFRNTFRILLGNLNGFDLKRDAVPESQWTELDLYVIWRLQDVVKMCLNAYEEYEFHQVYHVLNRFCAVELSALYVDVLKDRMYCDGNGDVRRRSAQTAMHEILETICKLLAPIMPFTTEEVWQQLVPGMTPDIALKRESVHLQEFPKVREIKLPDGFEGRWSKLLALRVAANEQLEKARQGKVIGKSLEAGVEIKTKDFSKSDVPLLEEVLIVSRVELAPGDSVEVSVKPASGHRCVRCWKHTEDVGKDLEHPELCGRCASVVKEKV
jgi:isoleucyl-tRNA synthetase